MSPSRNESEPSRISKSSRRLYQLDGVKPLSLNEAYATMQGKNKNPTGKGGWKNKVWRKKTAEAEFYQWLIQETLHFNDLALYGPKLRIPDATKYQGIALTLVFFVPPKELRIQDHLRFKGRDVSNYVKLIEDAVFEYLSRVDDQTFPVPKAKIQDSSSIEPLSFKRVSWDDDWHFQIWLSDDVWAHQPHVYHAGQLIDVYGSAYAGTPTLLGQGLRQRPDLRLISDELGSGTHLPPPAALGEHRPPAAVPVS